MADNRILEGEHDAQGLRIAVVASRFNELVVDSLLKGALDALARLGASERDLTVVRVPGAWELPLAVDRLCQSRRYDAVVALGAVIRGATPHFDYVAGDCARGLAAAAVSSGVPVGFGVLTTDTLEQALERAGSKAGNKGADAALSAVEMARLLRHLDT